MHTAIGFIAIASLVTITIKELVITKETGVYNNLKKFLDITIFILVALFVYLFILTVIEILHNK